MGQSDPVPPTLKHKLYIGYFIRASLHRSRTSSGGGDAEDILNKGNGTDASAHRRLSMNEREMTYPMFSEFYHASRISRKFRVFRLNSVFRANSTLSR